MKNTYPLLIVILLALVAGHYFFSPKEIYIVHDCDIQKSGYCILTKDDVELELSLNPTPIIPTEDVSYTLKTRGLKVEEATIRLLGHDMEMPRDEQVFSLSSLTNPHLHEATRAFPTCTEKLMTWRIYLVLKGQKKWVRTTFDLEVKRI
jgi:hypothetical protein